MFFKIYYKLEIIIILENDKVRFEDKILVSYDLCSILLAIGISSSDFESIPIILSKNFGMFNSQGFVIIRLCCIYKYFLGLLGYGLSNTDPCDNFFAYINIFVWILVLKNTQGLCERSFISLLSFDNSLGHFQERGRRLADFAKSSFLV